MTVQVLFLDGPLVGELWPMAIVLPHIKYAEPIRVFDYSVAGQDGPMREIEYEFIGDFHGDGLYRLSQ